MKLRFSYKKIDKNGKKALKETVRAQKEALQEILGSLDSDAVQLEGRIEKHPRKPLYRARLKLRLPGRTLAALEEAEEAGAVLHAVFAELRRQLERQKHLMKSDHLWKRPRRRAELRSRLKEATPADEESRRQEYLQLIDPHLTALYHFIRRELAYHQALDELLPSEIGADEVLDAVVVRGWERYPERPAHLDVLPWLTGIALEVIGEELERHRARERSIALEAAPPETPMDVTDDFDTEYYEYHEPEEVIRLEDLIPDLSSAEPETAEALWERNLAVQKALSRLPRRWRHALVLADVLEMAPEEIAELVGVSAERLPQVRECAEGFMREWLEQQLSEEEIADLTLQDLLALPLEETVPETLQEQIRRKFGSA